MFQLRAGALRCICRVHGVDRAGQLARTGYYDGIIFHRVIRVRASEIGAAQNPDVPFAPSQDFMVQGGDPTGTGRGGKSIYGCARAHAPLDPRELAGGQIHV